MRIYRLLEGDLYLGRTAVYLPDRPGALVRLASLFSTHNVNIVQFDYNRTEHPHRVILEVEAPVLDDLLASAREVLSLSESPLQEPTLELAHFDTDSILSMDVRLEHRPGTLGAFAALLADHGANVIFMRYHEEVSTDSARFSLATSAPGEVDRILKDMNAQGYHYSLRYRGSAQGEVEGIIGLNLVERFYLKLRDLLGQSDAVRLRQLVDSSRTLSESLVRFSREAGKDMEAGSLFTGVLAFTSASLLRSGAGFGYRALAPVQLGPLTYRCFRLPTGGNLHLLKGQRECVMIDGGYGLYYEDAKRLLSKEGLDPAAITHIYLSHADSDHAGMSGAFEAEFGTRVHMHIEALRAIEHRNRAHGSTTPYLALNALFTELVDELTRARYPKDPLTYGGCLPESPELVAGFRVLDFFELDSVRFLVLESLGGHVPGQVFFHCPEPAVLFTSDYLLNVASLEASEREILSYPKFMMISTNVDSVRFRQEMGMLEAYAAEFGGSARGGLLVAPGHGDWYWR